MSKTAMPPGAVTRPEWTQIRRCHRCDQTHESRGERVLSCAVCGAHFAPFFYSELTPEAMLETTRSPLVRPKSFVFSSARNYRPLVGITWWWTDSVRTGVGELLMAQA